MTNRAFKVLAAVALSAASQFGFAHSAMFPDKFRYDDSNEGRAAVQAGEPGKARLQQSDVACENGLAGDYPCRNIDMRALMGLNELGSGGANLNDVWGWTDLATGTEVAIVGAENGTAFVDVSDPSAPVLLGFLPSHNGGSDDWRDIKVYQDHAFIVADGGGNAGHGLQVFDLSSLLSLTPGATLSASAHYGGFGSAHNIAINEETGFAYIVGGSQCSGGLYMIDISSPATPTFAGCYSAQGYTHDAECVVYQGPDSQYFDQEICVAYNEDSIAIVNVEDKNNPQLLSTTTYPGVQYTHQGWFLDANHSTLLMNDELDENIAGSATTTYVWDVSSLGAPTELGRFQHPTNAIDHNLYTRDGLVYQSNYRAGLRILGTDAIDQGTLSELAYFDTIPCSDEARFSGAWSSYVYFASGTVVTSDIGTGLFVLQPDAAAIASAANPGTPALSPACGGSAGSVGGVDATSGTDVGNTGSGSDGSGATEDSSLAATSNNSGGGGGSLPATVVLALFGLLRIKHRFV